MVSPVCVLQVPSDGIPRLNNRMVSTVLGVIIAAAAVLSVVTAVLVWRVMHLRNRVTNLVSQVGATTPRRCQHQSMQQLHSNATFQ
mmetsp:Transcript_35731/g.63723  ORF Transcript_35731/g.63723 Transcript_35731/m.63723 type:complete len:86 (+) Transcript_35731:470-727(+)